MSQSVSDERLERALAVAALVVELHGDTYLPIFERLERELEARRAKDSPRARARRYLEQSGIGRSPLELPRS